MHTKTPIEANQFLNPHTYTWTPIFIGGANNDSANGEWIQDLENSDDPGGYFLTASKCSIEQSPNTKQMFDLCFDGTKQRSVKDGDLSTKINIEFYLITDDPTETLYRNNKSYAFLHDNWVGGANDIQYGNGNGRNYFSIWVDGNLFRQCFLDSYTVDVGPVSPVRVSATFTCLLPYTDKDDLLYKSISDASTQATYSQEYSERINSERFCFGFSSQIFGLFEAGILGGPSKREGGYDSDEIVTSFNYTRQYTTEFNYYLNQDSITSNSIYNVGGDGVTVSKIDTKFSFESNHISQFLNPDTTNEVTTWRPEVNSFVDFAFKPKNSKGQSISGPQGTPLVFKLKGKNALYENQSWRVQEGDSVITRINIKRMDTPEEL